MTYSLINVGTAPNDGTGDPLRTAFKKVNVLLTNLNDGSGTYRVIDTGPVVAEAGQVVFVDSTEGNIAISPPPNPVLGSTVDVYVLDTTVQHSVTFNGINIPVGINKKFTFVSETFGWVSR